MLLPATETITDLRRLKGVEFPSLIRFRQLLITGPPGCGKTTLIRRIGGWSEEGYIDLAINKWWTAQTLAIRPREVHLGIPYVGHKESLAVYDDEWTCAPETPQPDLERIILPPRKRHFLSVDWSKRHALEFLLPPVQAIYEWRRERASKGTHHVDQTLSLELVARQLETFYRIGEYMHRKGMTVYIRAGLGGPLARFCASGAN